MDVIIYACPKLSARITDLRFVVKAVPYEIRQDVVDMDRSTFMDHAMTDDLIQWRHYGPDGVSNHRPHGCLINRVFGRRSNKTSKICVTGLCAGNTGEFRAQMASYAENVSIWWRHHVNWCLMERNLLTSMYVCLCNVVHKSLIWRLRISIERNTNLI